MVSQADLQECRKTQLRLLNEFAKVCEEHKLIYWIDFGTLLGAIRHKGFIPWDDDLDVSMPIPDYKRFLEIGGAALPKDIFLQTSKTDPSFKQSYAKLRDCYSTMIEHHETPDYVATHPYHKGIFIDIFPSALYPTLPVTFRKVLMRTTVRSRDKAIVFPKKWFHPLVYIPVYLLCKFAWLLLSPLKKTGFGMTPDDNGYMYVTSLKHLYPLKDVAFEDGQYPAPNNPDGHLTSLYRDYMTPPPPDKRGAHATHIFPHTPCNHPRAMRKPGVEAPILAPVAMFVYNRLKNTKEVIEALKNNYLATDTDLFIFSDAAGTPKQEKPVAELRAYLKTVTGFKSVTVIERPENFYIERNIIEGVTEIVNRFGRIIVLEDDGVAAPNFLSFMNDALDFYDDKKKVMHIGTFTFIRLPDSFRKTILWHYAENTGGGWGTWKDRWEKFEWFKNESDGLAALTEDQKERISLGGVFGCLQGLRLNPIPWDVCWNIALMRNEGFGVNSPRALIRNNGLYNGTHFSVFNRLAGKNQFEVALDTDERMEFESELVENKEAVALLTDFYRKLGNRPRDKAVDYFVRTLVYFKITKLARHLFR